MVEIFLEDDEVALIASLLIPLRQDLPEGLCPTFYRTLTYEGDYRLKRKADDLCEKLGMVLVDG